MRFFMPETYDFYRFHRDGMIPLYVGEEISGYHPEKLFHDHNFSELVLVISGEAEHLTEGKKCVLKRGDILSLHPGTVHAYDKCSNLRIVNVLYDCSSLAIPVLDAAHISSFHRLFPLKNIIPAEEQNAPVTNLTEEQFEEIMGDVMRLRSVLDGKRPGCLFLGLAIFMQIIAKISMWAETVPQEHYVAIQVEKAIAYMTQNCDGKVSFEQLLKKSNMSRRNFYRHFKNYTGVSPVEYLVQLRIRRAMELLRDTDTTISEISQLCGFADSNYMCRIFRKRYELSPGEFRKKLRNNSVSDQSMLNTPTIIVRKTK